MNPLPKVVDAVRAVVRAHIDLKKAQAVEASPRAKLRLQRDLFNALEQLELATFDLEKALVEAKKTRRPFPWMSMLKAADGLLGILAKAQTGTLGAKDVSAYVRNIAATDVVDAEVVEEKRR